MKDIPRVISLVKTCASHDWLHDWSVCVWWQRRSNSFSHVRCRKMPQGMFPRGGFDEEELKAELDRWPSNHHSPLGDHTRK